MVKPITTKKAGAAAALFLLLFLFLLWKDRKKTLTIIDMRGKLPHDPNQTLRTRSEAQIKELTIHHTAGAALPLEKYARDHILRGLVTIAYGEMIDEEGILFVCHDPTTVSYHNENNNTHTYGICLIGNFENTEPTAAQLETLDQRIKYWRKRLPNQVDVKGHGEYKATACPGDNLQKHLNQYKLKA